jgi:hypothetical protein
MSDNWRLIGFMAIVALMIIKVLGGWSGTSASDGVDENWPDIAADSECS